MNGIHDREAVTSGNPGAAAALAAPAAPVFFSAGPWAPAGGFDEAESVLSADHQPVADLYGRLPIRRANAALIAAAPDLYYAARVALDKLEHLPGQSAVACAALASAIRKAEGRA